LQLSYICASDLSAFWHSPPDSSWLSKASWRKQTCPFYTDNLVNSFQDWSWNCTRNFVNTSQSHSGSDSVSVTITSGGGALSLQYSAGFNTAPYASLSF